MAEDIVSRLRLIVNQQDFKQGAGLYNQLKSAAKDAGQAIKEGFDRATQATRDFARQRTDILQTLENREQSFQKKLDETRQKLEQQKKSAGQVDIGRIGSSAGQVRGALGGFGLEGAGGGLQITQDIADVVEALPRLKAEFIALGETIATSPGILGELTKGVGTLLPTLPPAAAGFLAVAGPIAAVTAAIGLVTAIMGELERSAQEAYEAEKSLIEARNAALDVELEAAELLARGDIEGLVAARNKAFEDSAKIARQAADAQERMNELRAQEQELLDKSVREEGLGFRDQGTLREIQASIRAEDEALQSLVQTQSVATTKLDEYDQALKTVNPALVEAANQVYEFGRVGIDITAELNKAQQELAAAEQQRIGVEQNLARLQEQATQVRERFAENEARLTEDRTIREQREQEDRAARFAEHQAQLAEIERQGNERVEQLRAELAALPAEREQELADAVAKGNIKLAEINADFFKRSQESLQDFYRQEARIDSEFQKQRLRTIEDINARLNDAARSNDVIAFLKAQEEGAQTLKRQAEDAADAEKQRVDDFVRQQEDIREAYNQQVADTLAGIEEEKAAIAASYEERRAKLAEQIELERQQNEERLAQAEANFQKELARQALLDKRRAEDQAREDARRAEAHAQELARIAQQAAAEQQALAQVNAAIQQIAASAAQLRSQASFGASSRSSGRTRSSSIGVSTPTAPLPIFTRRHAEGGIETEPTLALLGERPGFGDMVIPFRKSEGIDKALARHTGGRAGRAPIHITLAPNMTIGDIASMSAVRREVMQGLQAVSSEVAALIEGALEGEIAA